MSFLSSGTFGELEGLGGMSHRHHSFHEVLNTPFSFVPVLMFAVTRNESGTSISHFVAEVVFCIYQVRIPSAICTLQKHKIEKLDVYWEIDVYCSANYKLGIQMQPYSADQIQLVFNLNFSSGRWSLRVLLAPEDRFFQYYFDNFP